MPCPKASCMPSAVVGAQIVGHLRPEIARELGLTGDVAVAPGSGDNQMSALGAGAVKEGTWVVSLGDFQVTCTAPAYIGNPPSQWRTWVVSLGTSGTAQRCWPPLQCPLPTAHCVHSGND